MTNGRLKGNRFENAVCRPVSGWLAPEFGTDFAVCPVAQLPFRRRSTSIMPVEGHWEGRGDILHRPDIECPYAFECKNIEGWELDGMMANAKWPGWAWWSQAKEQAEKAGLIPLLIFTRNRRPIYAMTTEEELIWLQPKPKDGPVLALTHTTGEKLGILLLSDLVMVPRARVLTQWKKRKPPTSGLCARARR